MQCPICKSETRVLETRPIRLGNRRRRECKKCGHRFTTYELPVVALVGKPAAIVAPDYIPDPSPDSDEIADAVMDQIDERLRNLPDEVVERVMERVEEEMRLGPVVRGELEAGDDEEAD
jgi:transcriptional repressor NrdR